MSRLSAVQAIAEAAATMTREYDLADALARLVRACAEALSVDAIGLLVVAAPGRLELLSATSHRVAELEAYQIQQDSGPCVEAINESTLVSIAGAEAIKLRWPDVGPAILEAGYETVSAYPLRWHGFTLGAMNTFDSSATATDEDGLLLGQAFADIAAVLIVQDAPVSLRQVTERVQAALRSRTAIERAKGVLAYQHRRDMASAYELLLELAVRHDLPLSEMAERVIEEARRGLPPVDRAP